MSTVYQPLRPSRSEFVPIRRLRYHVRVWDPIDAASGCTLFLLHGWMDVSASFQFLVDCLPATVRIIAPDWRGYGLTDWSPAEAYWFPDYVADLDALLEHYSPAGPARLVGHSMGGNVAMLYAGTRPERVGRLVSLEGIGLRGFDAAQAPERYAQWLGELRAGMRLQDYPSGEAVAQRLMRNNPRLAAPLAAWLAGHWSRCGADGRHVLRADPAHKLINPDLYRVDETQAFWRRIAADVMMVLSSSQDGWHRFVRTEEFRQRLQAIASLTVREVADAGHMMHHDQPREVARLIEEFLC